jgi:hypothetical protein
MRPGSRKPSAVQLSTQWASAARRHVTPAPVLQARTEFWRDRSAESEHVLADTRAQAARLAGELLAARAGAELLATELAAARKTLQQQADNIGKMAAEAEAWGETRLWRERGQAVEAQAFAKAREDNILFDTFRQRAYQRGAAILPILRKGSS